MDLEQMRLPIFELVQRKVNGEDIKLKLEDLCHPQHLQAVPYPTKKLSHYPLNQRSLDKKVMNIIRGFKYDMNRPICIIVGFPVSELPAVYRKLINKRLKYIDIVYDGHGRLVMMTYLGLDTIYAYIRDDIKTIGDLNTLFADINESYKSESKPAKQIHEVRSQDNKTVEGKLKKMCGEFGFTFARTGKGSSEWNVVACPKRCKLIYISLDGQHVLYWTLYLLFQAFDGDPYSLRDEMIKRFAVEIRKVWNELESNEALIEVYCDKYAEFLKSARIAEEWYKNISPKQVELRIKNELQQIHIDVINSFQNP